VADLRGANLTFLVPISIWEWGLPNALFGKSFCLFVPLMAIDVSGKLYNDVHLRGFTQLGEKLK
jgi:hypothetical protein